MKITTLSTLDQSASLCDLPAEQFETGGAVAAALKAAGYDESAPMTIGQLGWWGMTVAELCGELADQG